MDLLPLEIIIYISEFLSDSDKLHLFSISKEFRKYISMIRFETCIPYRKIKNNKLFDCFTGVDYIDKDFKDHERYNEILRVPKNIREITVCNSRDLDSLFSIKYNSELSSQIRKVYIAAMMDRDNIDSEKFRNLKVLRINACTFHRITIPEGVEETHISRRLFYVEPWTNIYIPKSLKKLMMSYCFSMSVIPLESLPRLKEIHLKLCNNLDLHNIMPLIKHSLEYLSIDFFYTELFSELKNLKTLKYIYSADRLQFVPDSVQKLCISTERKLPSFPKGLKTLHIKEYDDKEGPLCLPESLEVLNIHYSCVINQPVNLPKNLKVLKLFCNANVILNEGLEYLVLGEEFKRQVDIPKSLKMLKIENETLNIKLCDSEILEIKRM
jgi:hypothetical protein